MCNSWGWGQFTKDAGRIYFTMLYKDVCIVGGGPAGLAAANILAARGLTVVVVGYDPDRATNSSPGETLSPAVLESMHKLGLENEFQELRLPEISGFKSTWGSPAMEWRDKSLSPRGSGWLLDRRAFERMLGAQAEKLGVVLRREHAANITQHHHASRVWLKSSGSSICARLLIYATGRHGIQEKPRNRILVDRLVACVTLVQTSASAWDRAVRIDALEKGWIYSIQISATERALALFTDGDLLRATTRKAPLESVAAAVAEAPTVSQVVSPGELRTMQGSAMYWAVSQFRLTAWGERWIGCGDAAQSYDPLASMGVALAIEDGIEAAEALVACLCKDNSDALLRRDLNRRERFISYLKDRYSYYGLEHRWRSAPFWKRRQSEHALRGISARQPPSGS